MRTRLLLVAFFALMVPDAARAAVLINEVAWMGTLASSNAEWIELINTGNAPVDLSGWQLTASSGSPSIALSGTISAGGYFLLERTSDASVPSVPANQVYTGALTNAGATLTLANGATTIDEVDGGTDWANIGGDNVTKDTAQRSGSGWVTAASTPGGANPGASSGASSAPAESAPASSSASSALEEAYAPPSSLGVSIDGPDELVVGVPARFSARATRAKEGVRVAWGFGDGSSAEGTVVEKTYLYPGTYLVVATAESGVSEGRDDLTVSVGNSSVRVSDVSALGIKVANDSSARLDLSGWRLSTDGRIFRIPQGTQLLPKSEVLFSRTITDFPITFEATLLYPSGAIAAAYPSPEEPQTMQPPAVAESSHVVQKVVPESLSSVSGPAHEIEAVSAPAAAPQPAAAGAAFVDTEPLHEEEGLSRISELMHSPWTFGLFGLIALSAGAFILL